MKIKYIFKTIMTNFFGILRGWDERVSKLQTLNVRYSSSALDNTLVKNNIGCIKT